MTGPHPGSRPHRIAALALGERTFFEAPSGRLSAFMQQVGTDIGRCGLRGRVAMAHVLGIQPVTREVIELVMCTRVTE